MSRPIILAAALLLAACTAPAPAPARPDRATDEAALRATLDRWYAAMQARDSAGTLAPLTPEFLLLEDTLPLSGPALVTRLRADSAQGTWTAAFSDWRTRIDGDVAWTTLRNHETSRPPAGGACEADFLETIVFVRRDGAWFIDRYHAAALNRWRCAP